MGKQAGTSTLDTLTPFQLLFCLLPAVSQPLTATPIPSTSALPGLWYHGLRALGSPLLGCGSINPHLLAPVE